MSDKPTGSLAECDAVYKNADGKWCLKMEQLGHSPSSCTTVRLDE
jgi:hypothetical protein